MAKIKILCWNVENFKADKQAVVAAKIKEYSPDVFGIIEVRAASVYDFMKENVPNHSVFITEGQQSQEILVACRNSRNHLGIKFQQKREFKSGNPGLRPGAFLTFQYKNKGQYNFLFLHTYSGVTAVDFGNRTEMFDHAYNLKRKLDDENGAPVNYVMLGDFNTMGVRYPRQVKADQVFVTTDELTHLDYYASRKSLSAGRRRSYKNLKPMMRRLSKPIGTYYNPSYGESDLDHIYASDHLDFVGQTNFGEQGRMDVKLDGWRRFIDDSVKKKKYADEVSDHCLLYCELKI